MDTKQIEEMLEMMFIQAQMQFGKAIKGFWFCEEDDCPGCGAEVNEMGIFSINRGSAG